MGERFYEDRSPRATQTSARAAWARVRIVPGATAFTPLIFDSYPWSHSLVMAFVWGVALAVVSRRWISTPIPGLLVALVVSHPRQSPSSLTRKPHAIGSFGVT